MADSKRKAVITGSVSDSHAPSTTKRQRVSRACDQCRTAREKCDGIQPSCFTCASQNRNCSYTVNPKKRGIPPGYIKSLEVALAWTFINVPGSEEALRATLSSNGQGLVTGKDTDGVSKLHKRWRRSAVCKEIDRLLSGTDGNASSATDPPSPESGNDDHEPASAPSDIALLTPSSIVVTEIPHVTHSQSDFMGLGINRSPTPKPADQSRRLIVSSRIILPSNLWQLVDIYYAYTHCWFPILEKQNILKTAYSYPEDGLYLHPQESDSGRHAELWSVLALASFQAASAKIVEHDKLHTEMRAQPADPEALYNQAQSLIPPHSGSHDFGHVTSLLLLALIEVGRQDFQYAWLLVGYAVRIMSLLSRESKGQGERNGRDKHASLACFVLDTFISAQLGLQPHLKSFWIDELSPVSEDGLDEWHAWVGCRGFTSTVEENSRSPAHALSTFNRLCTLAGLMNDAISTKDQREKNRVRLELEQWRRNLPDSCNFVYLGQTKLKNLPTPPLLHLRMAYEYTNVVCNSSHVSSTQASSSSYSIPVAVQEYIDVCGRAALPPIAALYMATPCSYQRQDLAVSISNVLSQTWTKFRHAANLNPIPLPIHTEDAMIQHKTSPAFSTGRTTHQVSANIPADEMQQTNMMNAPQMFPNVSATRSSQDGQGRMRTPLRSSISSLASLNSPSEAFHHPYLSASSINTFASTNSVISEQSNTPRSITTSAGNSNFATIYNPANPLDPYGSNRNTAGSNPADIDALFDELASLDGADGATNQPQFMQNLGFAPDVDLTDVLANDYGQFDPFTMFMQQQGGGFDGGIADPG